MKTEFKAKFLQHIAQKRSDNKGFTLVELLVVIIIIGILSAIALPSFLNQANKAKQSEAKQNVGSMNRSQTSYLAENAIFGSTVEVLGMGIQTQTVNYQFFVGNKATSGNAAANYGEIDTTLQTQYINNMAVSMKGPLRSYKGGIAIGTVVATSESTSLAVMCETKSIGKFPNLSDNFVRVEPANITAGTCPTAAYKLVEAK